MDPCGTPFFLAFKNYSRIVNFNILFSLFHPTHRQQGTAGTVRLY